MAPRLRRRHLKVEQLESRAYLSAKPLPGFSEPLVRIHLEVVDANGDPIETVTAGEDFYLRAWVRDTRGGSDAQGVAAAYVDVFFHPELVTFANDELMAEFGATFQDCKVFVGSSGAIQESGGFAGFNMTGSEEQLLWSVRLHAEQAGLARFVANRPDNLPSSAVLIFGVDFDITDSTEFVGTQLEIVNPDGSMPAVVDFLVSIPDESVQAVDSLQPNMPDQSGGASAPRIDVGTPIDTVVADQAGQVDHWDLPPTSYGGYTGYPVNPLLEYAEDPIVVTLDGSSDANYAQRFTTIDFPVFVSSETVQSIENSVVASDGVRLNDLYLSLFGWGVPKTDAVPIEQSGQLTALSEAVFANFERYGHSADRLTFRSLPSLVSPTAALADAVAETGFSSEYSFTDRRRARRQR